LNHVHERGFVFSAVAPASAQANRQQAATPASPTSKSIPIRCWWRTSSGVGADRRTLRLVADVCDARDRRRAGRRPISRIWASKSPRWRRSRWSAAAIRPTCAAGNRRFFQYQYVLRIINPDAIGKDVKIPDTVIHYKVNSRVAANTSIRGAT
jgi:hypothetical protein